MTSPIGPTAMAAVLAARDRFASGAGEVRQGASLLEQFGGISFEETVREALRTKSRDVSPPAEVEAEQDQVATETGVQNAAQAAPNGEALTVAREASRTHIDPAILVALRRAENGSRGREFGVLSVPADGLEAQARVAANTVRNTLERFTNTGGTAVDPATGKYTEDFLRFLSARYAPVGAANDPTGLNRHHAANLVALYKKASSAGG